ncbi:hypothetical protein O3M35_009648 [Rhynocoris fuscipes]
MESMEEKLQKYRKEKAKVNNSYFIPVKNLVISSSSNSLHQETEINGDKKTIDSVDELSGQDDSTEMMNFDEGSIKNEENFKKSSEFDDNNNFDATIGITLAILWLLGLYIFINIGFAMLYVCISLLIFICENTRTMKDNNEISAYSVFNKNCEQIEGTLDARQIDDEIFGGLISFM